MRAPPSLSNVRSRGGGASHSCQDLDPGWRSISWTGGCCLGLSVRSLEMEVASESIISVVDEEECNDVSVVTL